MCPVSGHSRAAQPSGPGYCSFPYRAFIDSIRRKDRRYSVGWRGQSVVVFPKNLLTGFAGEPLNRGKTNRSAWHHGWLGSGGLRLVSFTRSLSVSMPNNRGSGGQRPALPVFSRFVSLSISNEGVVQRRFSPKWRPALHAPLVFSRLNRIGHKLIHR
jgi:hypothetical protein